MSRNNKVITITLPKELDSLIDRLVKESKHTAKPISKSRFIAVACNEMSRGTDGAPPSWKWRGGGEGFKVLRPKPGDLNPFDA